MVGTLLTFLVPTSSGGQSLNKRMQASGNTSKYSLIFVWVEPLNTYAKKAMVCESDQSDRILQIQYPICALTLTCALINSAYISRL